MSAEEESLIPYTEGGLYKRDRSEHQDKAWKYAYFTLIAVCAAGAGFAYSNRSDEFTKLKPEFLSNPDNCPSMSHGGRMLRESSTTEFDLNEFWHVAKYWLGGTVVASLALGSLFVLMFQHMAVALVWTCMALVEAAWLSMAVAAFASDETRFIGVLFAGMSILWIWIVYRWRSRLMLCAQLLCVACKALQANPLLTSTIFSLGVGTVFVALPMVIFLVLGLANGYVSRTVGAIADYSHSDNPYGCIDDAGKPVMCCSWQLDTWAYVYVAGVAVMIIWTSSIACQLQAYTIAGTAAQWYFAPVEGSSMRTFSSAKNIQRSLGHGLTTSFGSLCFAGFVLPIIQQFKAYVNQAQNGHGSIHTIIAAILRCFLSGLLSILEAITKFAITSMAITGKSFYDSGCAVTSILRRNLLSSVGVWTFPPMVLGLCTMLLCCTWALAVYACAAVAWSGHPQGNTDAVILACFAGYISVAVLTFYTTAIINVVDACYVCWAMDLDNNCVTRQDMHDIYAAIPTGKLVVQPDEELAYGAGGAVDQHPQPSATSAPVDSLYFGPPMDMPVQAPRHYPTQPVAKV